MPIIKKIKVPVEISARHAHLSQEDLEDLFGQGYKLKPLKELSQPGQYAAKETIDIIGPKGIIKDIRIIGPTRPKTQIEISKTDGYMLGEIPPIRVSGDVVGSPGIIIRGPRGELKTREGLIAAMRHLHVSPQEAKQNGLENGQLVAVEVAGRRSVIFNNVIVRLNSDFRMSFQIDTDEGNAADAEMGDTGNVLV
jgi:acetate kinase